MNDLIIPKGDYGYNLNFTIKDDDDAAYNLAGYTVTFKVWPVGMSGSPIVSSGCVNDVEASGTCHYAVKLHDFDIEGDYYVELELTKAGIVESTRNYTLRVEESG
jgi:hypothetical protein